MVSEHSLPLIWGHFLTTACGSSGSKYVHRNIYLSSGQGDNSVFVLYLIASFEQGLKNKKPKSLKKNFLHSARLLWNGTHNTDPNT